MSALTKRARNGALIGIAALIVAAVLSNLVRAIPGVQSFEQTYPGVTPTALVAPIGIPAWLAWQHYLNALFLVLIVRTALNLRTKQRPPAFYRRRNTGLIKTAGEPRRISVYLWLHLSADALWVTNGVLYVVLLFATGQWLRIVPTDWAIIPNAITAALQYASLHWPVDNGWVNYNALQTLSYFGIVFIVAPLAAISGLRLSPAWPLESRATAWMPERLWRRIHNLSLWVFVVFVVVHITLVLTTGALRNLNNMFGGSDEINWVGAGVAALAIATMVVAWVAVRPAILKRVAARFGEVR